jgi:hypothetical protein
LREKKGSYRADLKAVDGNLVYLKFNLEAGRQSYREIASGKIY